MVWPISDEKLMRHILYYGDEVRPFQEVPACKGVAGRELDLATQLIHHLQSKTWNPGMYRDTYRERVLALIKEKESGEKIVTSKPARTGGKVVDLMTALKHSLARGTQSGRAPAQGKKKARTKTSKRAHKAA